MGTSDYTRRQFIKTAATAAAGLSTFGCAAIAPRLRPEIQRPDRPNLLFIWTDQQRADTMEVYGNTKIHAPNLNRLAAESIVFQKAYVTQPVCTPSRSSVVTGLWPHTTGCTANNIPLPEDTPCFPELLNDPAYRTAYMGKWHLGDEIFLQHGFHEWVSIEDLYISHYRPERDRSLRSGYHHFLTELGYQPDLGDKFSRKFAASLPIEHCKPKFLELQACDFLRRHSRKPFILYINFLEPHSPYSGPLNDEHDPAEIDLPANFNDPLEENEPLRYRLLQEYYQANYGESEQEYRELIARYYGLVTQVDRSVGAILNTLDELGLRDSTIVVYTSDHGDMMGSHRMVTKQVMYEESSRVPWLVRIPQLADHNRIIKAPVSHIDMVPTLMELLAGEADADLPGQSLVPLIRGEKVAEDHVFIEWNPNVHRVKPGSTLAPQSEMDRVAQERTRAVVSPDGWKLCLSDADKCQLFNLNSDPGETTNLYDPGRHQDVIRRLTDRIHRWQEKSRDQVVV
ncbi:MAG: sulfatase-like hydrolase/transferase [Fidelibacterota bacterium]|nr:MAG: sulfatase-like hydrolase/transferase [Candidatus Neomarinimicrobiota bacterium]